MKVIQLICSVFTLLYIIFRYKMELFYAKQLFKVTVIVVLFVISFHCEMVEKGIKLHETKQATVSYGIFWGKDTIEKFSSDICYSYFGTFYGYCENSLFCNKEETGCCPVRNSENNCGHYCVPPGYTCCNNYGACEKKNPTCCNTHCCGENENCCDKKCCSGKSECCGNSKNEFFCVSKLTSTIDLSPGHCDKVKCGIEDEIIKYFTKICKLFAEKTREQNINIKKKRQFAVLTLNKITEDEQYDPFPIVFELENQKGNYLSAPPYHGSHAETRILKGITDKIEGYKKDSKPFPQTIYLFTFLSPCKRCVTEIIELTKDNYVKGTHIYIGWQITYDGINQKDFLDGLGKMIDVGITFVYTPAKICTSENDDIPLVQPTLLTDLVHKYEGVHFCEIGNSLRSSFAKLINWLVWNCKEQFTLDGDDTTKNNVINCMVREIKQIKPEINPCMELSDTITNSINNLYKVKENTKLLLSPPLDPQSQTDTISISNKLADLKADYKVPYFCFQVNYNSVED